MRRIEFSEIVSTYKWYHWLIFALLDLFIPVIVLLLVTYLFVIYFAIPLLNTRYKK